MKYNFFDDLEKQLQNPNLTKEEKARLIEEAGNNYRAAVDRDLNRYIRDQRIGAALDIGIAAIPFGGGIGGSIAKQVVPKTVQKTMGRQFTTDIAASAIGSAIDGAVFGYGRGLMEGQNPSKTALEDASLGFGTGAVLGGALGKIVADTRAAETKGINQMRKYWGIPWRKASGNPELAIKTLVENKQGFVPNVFNKPGIGNFDIPWGNEKYGLKHAIERRSGQKNFDINEFVNNIPKSIREGIVTQGSDMHPDTLNIESLKLKLPITKNFKSENITRNWLVSTHPQNKSARKRLGDLTPSQNISSENGSIPHSISELLAKYNINDYLQKNNPAKWLNQKSSTAMTSAIRQATSPTLLNTVNKTITQTPETSQPVNNQPTALSGHIKYDNTIAQEKIFTPDEIGKMSQQEFATHEHAIRNQLQRGLINPQTKDFSGFTNPISGNNKIFTKEDIDKMSNDEFSSLEPEINAQWGSIGIPNEQELRNNNGAVYVESYTRADGTKVKGYYRSR